MPIPPVDPRKFPIPLVFRGSVTDLATDILGELTFREGLALLEALAARLGARYKPEK